jgi:hypothetical protein
MTPQEITAKAQLEIIQGYYSKIVLNNLTIEQVLELFEKDREYLQQEFAIIQAKKIVS